MVKNKAGIAAALSSGVNPMARESVKVLKSSRDLNVKKIQQSSSERKESSESSKLNIVRPRNESESVKIFGSIIQ